MEFIIDFKEKFGFGDKEVLPVVHLLHGKQALREAEVVFNAGAKGLFVIGASQTTKDDELISAVVIKNAFPDKFIGVNLLGCDPEKSVELVLHSGLDGLWTDFSGIDDMHVSKSAEKADILLRMPDAPDLVYFGGVAFKYQMPVDDVEYAARNAADFMDVITTSGDETGMPPAAEKIEAMRKGAGSCSLAIASGISAENIGLYDADLFLVATSIQRDFFHVDEKKLDAILAASRIRKV